MNCISSNTKCQVSYLEALSKTVELYTFLLGDKVDGDMLSKSKQPLVDPFEQYEVILEAVYFVVSKIHGS